MRKRGGREREGREKEDADRPCSFRPIANQLGLLRFAPDTLHMRFTVRIVDTHARLIGVLKEFR
jgi:hypothetical protein